MAKKLTGEGKAEVKDYSNGQDGSKTVEVNYNFDYIELETMAEVQQEYSEKDLIALANAREKSSSNSAARQKAIAPFAQDPDAPAAIRERMVKDAVKYGKSREDAEKFVDALLAS
jgi:hypothetical protein